LQVCGYVCVYVYELSRIAFSHGSCVISLGWWSLHTLTLTIYSV
jgi:hypothetical protein